MSQKKTISNPAFAPTFGPSKGFNLAPQVNNFNSIFNTQPLDEKESHFLQKILFDNFLPGKVSDEQTEQDFGHLKKLTEEIKAISKQGIVLMGERIHKVRELLKPYRDGAFTQWIESTFGSRRTAYNMLSYYQLYSELPDHVLKERFKKLPQKAAYLLASKPVGIEEKVKFINEYNDSTADNLIMLIQDKFSSDEGDGRSNNKEANRALLDSIETALKKLHRRKNYLSELNLNHLEKIKKMIDEIMILQIAEVHS